MPALLKHCKLPVSFFEETPTLELAKKLLGCHIFTSIDGITTAGRIVETEAYCAPEDRASHAYNLRRTRRTETMYQSGGRAYVYLCYGIHHLFNVVCGPEGLPHAVLIRAVEPVVGLEVMKNRRGTNREDSRIAAGPGKLSQALGINLKLDGLQLSEENGIWIEAVEESIDEADIVEAKRVGIDYAGKWKDKLWRYYIGNSTAVSKK